MVKRNISFYERKKKLTQKHEFCTKVKVHIMGTFLFWTFRRWEIRSFLDSKSWCKMIFFSAWNTMFFEYGKVLLLNFSEIGNTVSFWSKKLIFSWYFSTFHDIPGLAKYGFWCSVIKTVGVFEGRYAIDIWYKYFTMICVWKTTWP